MNCQQCSGWAYSPGDRPPQNSPALMKLGTARLGWETWDTWCGAGFGAGCPGGPGGPGSPLGPALPSLPGIPGLPRSPTANRRNNGVPQVGPAVVQSVSLLLFKTCILISIKPAA